MGDEDRRDAPFAQGTHRAEQRVDLVSRERARRLVEDEHLCVVRERARDLDELGLARRQVLDEVVDICVAVECIEGLASALAGCPPVDAPTTTGLARAEEHVLAHAELAHEGAFLGHHGDAGRERLNRVAHRDGCAVH